MKNFNIGFANAKAHEIGRIVEMLKCLKVGQKSLIITYNKKSFELHLDFMKDILGDVDYRVGWGENGKSKRYYITSKDGEREIHIVTRDRYDQTLRGYSLDEYAVDELEQEE